MERLRNKLIAHPSMSWLKLNPLITWPDCLVSSKGHLCVNQFKLVDFSLIWRSLRRFHFGWLDDQPRSGGSFNHRISFNYLLSLTEIVFRRKEDKKKKKKKKFMLFIFLSSRRARVSVEGCRSAHTKKRFCEKRSDASFIQTRTVETF